MVRPVGRGRRFVARVSRHAGELLSEVDVGVHFLRFFFFTTPSLVRLDVRRDALGFRFSGGGGYFRSSARHAARPTSMQLSHARLSIRH